jgi:Ca-activated chloride channel family protein
MARAGLGEPFVVLGPQKAAAEAEKLRQMIDRPLLTNIEVHFGNSGAYEVAPEKIPDLLAERPLLIFGKYRGDQPTQIEISGRTGHGAFHHAIDLRPADARQENHALRALWARKWVEVLEDEFHMGGGKPVEDAITDLGLFYNLLTPFTSFVAIDSEIVNRTGKSDTVRQPLPMPEGVSNYAVAESQAIMPSPASVPARASGHLSKRMAEPMMVSDDMLSGPVGGVRAMKSAGAPMPKQAELAQEEDQKKSGARDKAAPCKVTVAAGKAEHASDTQALRALVERSARAHGCQAAAALKLRITLDNAGKIASVVVVSGDGGVGKMLVRRLTGAISATRATDQDTATVEITITIEIN